MSKNGPKIIKPNPNITHGVKKPPATPRPPKPPSQNSKD